MKQKLSITIDEEKIEEIKKLVEEGLFRSKSHVLEYSLNKFLKEQEGNQNGRWIQIRRLSWERGNW